MTIDEVMARAESIVRWLQGVFFTSSAVWHGHSSALKNLLSVSGEDFGSQLLHASLRLSGWNGLNPNSHPVISMAIVIIMLNEYEVFFILTHMCC